MERNGLVDVTLRRDAGKNSEMRAPGAQGQPGDMTEVDQIIVEVRGWGVLGPSPPPVICRLEQRQDSTEWAAAYIFFCPSLPSRSFSSESERADPALNDPVCSLFFSAVFKAHNMQLDLYTG